MHAPDGCRSGGGETSSSVEIVAAEPLDPFDTERLRTTEGLDDIGVESVLLTVPVRRPGRAEFFRVHPDPAYSIDWAVLERDDELDHETYWVTQRIPR